MLCQRCRGLLVHETFDGLSQEADMMCLATRCINCGSIEDSVVRANRLHLLRQNERFLAGWAESIPSEE